MTDTVIDTAWSNIHAGQFVRWATPRFIKYGRVVSRKGNSLVIEDLDDGRTIAIPEAKWYFVQFKMHGPRHEECLFLVDKVFKGKMILEPEADNRITVQDACELLRMDPKQLRRHIRRGRIQAHKDRESRWMIDRTHLMEVSARYGWI